jgi:hypothetical protein
VLFGVCDKRLHYSLGSLDLDELFLHLDAFRGFCKRSRKNPRQGLYMQRPGTAQTRREASAQGIRASPVDYPAFIRRIGAR